MSETAGLLDLSAERGARRLALGFLADAEAAHARMERGDDDEALHDFRVALRRLRSCVRAYRDHLAGSIGKKDRDRLAALADATSEARDLEVHAAWLERRLESSPEHERPAVLAEIRTDLEKAQEKLRREVGKDFPRERWRLARRLRFYQVEVDIDAPPGGPRLASAFGRRALDLAAALERRLEAVHALDDQEPAHRARIAAKRLRYLIEPFAGELEGAPELVKRLKRLQDALGEMHDADVLLARVGRKDDGDGHAAQDAGTSRLREMLERERAERFAAVEPEWLEGRAAGFFAAVRELAHAAMARGEPDREIERKYLLKRMPAIRSLPFRVQEIDQGYLPGDRLAERLRRIRENGQETYYRTVKLGKGISRTEVEEETDAGVFRKMWPLTKGKRVRKRRYKVKEGGFTWEIDRFRDRRLVLCEVELPSEDVDPPPPKWLRREIVRDVTGEPEYVNLNLAK